MFSTRRRVLAIAGTVLGTLFALSAGASAASKAATGPTPAIYLLCGTFMPGTDNFSGNSSVDHPSGASAMGKAQAVGSVPSGDACDNSSNGGMFSWTIQHDNVQLNSSNPQFEEGTEHGTAMIMQLSGANAIGFNGQITNYDFGSSADSCGDSDSRVFYYASGHAGSLTGCGAAANAPGNVNTQGGASSGQHFNGKYGTIVYQESDSDMDGSNCPVSASGPFCFEAVFVGFVN